MRTEHDYLPFSKLSNKNFRQEMIRLSKAPEFDSIDAEEVKHLLAELDTTDKELRKGMVKRLKDIYILNYHKMKNEKTERGGKIIKNEDPPETKVNRYSKEDKKKNKRLKGKMRIYM